MFFDPFTGDDGLHYFRLKAANGKIVATSEGYTRKASRAKTIAAIKRGAAKAHIREGKA